MMSEVRLPTKCLVHTFFQPKTERLREIDRERVHNMEWKLRAESWEERAASNRQTEWTLKEREAEEKRERRGAEMERDR